MPRLQSRTATPKLPPIPEVVWQQPQQTHLIDMHKNSITNIKHKTDEE